MGDEHKWKLAVARFQAIRNNVPGYVKESLVNEYHEVLEQMATASGEDMASFRIPQSEIKPRVTSVRPGSRGGRGSATYSSDNYCDQNRFERTLEALANSIPAIEAKTRTPIPLPPVSSKDYWSMPTQQLEELAGKYHIGGYADRHLSVDRDIIIRRLLERDQTLNPTASVAHHTINVGNMVGSSIQQNSPGASTNLTYSGSDLEHLVEQIRTIASQLSLTPQDKDALDADIATIEVQAKAGRMQSPVIKEALISARGIVERIASGGLTAGLLQLISEYLRHHH